MRILVLLTDLFDAVGGIQTFNRSLVKALDHIGRKRGWTISVLVLNDVPATYDPNGLYSSDVTYYRAFGGIKSRFLARAMLEASAAAVAIVGHVNFAPAILGLTMRKPRLRILLTIFGIEVWSKLTTLRTLSLRRVDRIVSISRSTRDMMAASTNLNGTPVDIVPCTLEPKFSGQFPLKSRGDLNLPEGKMILTTSRLDASDQYKRIEDVINALPAVLQGVPDAFYVIVGDGTDRPRLERLAQEVGVGNRVHFLGYVSNELLPFYYQASDVFVLPSTREGFGIVFLEAMHFAKPCVGVRAAAAPEVINDGITGLLGRPNDVDSLAQIISKLLSDESLRESMGKAGLNRLNGEFSFGSFCKSLEHVMDCLRCEY